MRQMFDILSHCGTPFNRFTSKKKCILTSQVIISIFTIMINGQKNKNTNNIVLWLSCQTQFKALRKKKEKSHPLYYLH